MSPFRPRFRIADILKFTAIVSVILAWFSWSGANLAFQADWPRSALYPLGVAVVFAFSFMGPSVSSLRCKSGTKRCESCGKSFHPAWNSKPSELCPTCRVANLPPRQRRRLATQGLILITVFFLMLSFVLLYPFSGLMHARLGALAYPISTFGLFVSMFVLLAVGMVLRNLVRRLRMTNPGYALRAARACAREVGKETRFGPVSVYVFGPDDPTSVLQRQVETCRTRYELLVGERLELERPLRFYVFGKRNALDSFFRWAFLYGSKLDGMYVPWSTPTISLTTEFPAYRLADPERITRVLLGYFFLDSHRKSPSPLWLQMGIANVVACGGDENGTCPAQSQDDGRPVERNLARDC